MMTEEEELKLVEENKLLGIRLYRKNYYQKNKKKIAEYQRQYYLRKKGLSPTHSFNWKGSKQKCLEIHHGNFTITFD